MTTEIKTWEIVDGRLEDVKSTLADHGRTEPFDLEDWIVSHPSIIGHDLTIIGHQVQTRSGPLDILAIDRLGNLVIVELKRDLLPREALAQGIDYASDVATWGIDRISEVCTKYSGKSLEDTLSEAYPEETLENINLNQSQKILLVGFAIESSLERMISWLSETFSVGINAIVLHYVVTSGGDELLARTSLISEEVVEERVQKRKFTIPMSDEPGHYETEELRDLLVQYLSQKMVTVRRIREVLLPACLEHGTVQREFLKQELVRKGEAEDLSSAGYALTAISSQIGMEKNDFLRQVIRYEYPTYAWEKDNYSIREGYEELVCDVLSELARELDLEI
jgi:hypothetical protein